MSNIYFLYRRLSTILLVVLLQAYPSLQVTFMTLFTIVNFVYTVISRPYESNNFGEILNETSIMLCAYLMNTFFMTNDPAMLETMGWVFIGIVSQNIGVSIMMMTKSIVTTTIENYQTNKAEKENFELLMKR